MNLQRADVLKGQATAFNWLAASELAQRRRLRMASSTSARACLASRAPSSAACAGNSTAVSLSSAATIRDWASFKALAASCSLQSASLIISSRARSAPFSLFNGALAQRLGAGFGLSGVIFYAAEDFGELSRRSLVPTAEQSSEHFRSEPTVALRLCCVM
jgi:hypothetical protein